MLKINFLNVGQGDSIVLEWNSDKNNKFGIIDSNYLNSTNPSLDYLKSKNIKAIQFVVLTHPHTDHFSGLFEILEYCEVNNIKIINFLIPSLQNPQFIREAVNDVTSKSELKKLFSKIIDLKEINIIENVVFTLLGINDIKLNNDIFVKILSPSVDEHIKYTKLLGILTKSDEDPTNNPNANILSTVLKIYSKRYNWYILFTSDVIEKTLNKLWTSKSSLILGCLFLGQCPHHGSKYNLEKMFWKTRNKISQTPIVISVGINSFGHPAQDTVDFFRNNDFNIYSTNQIGILNKINPLPSLPLSKKLNVFSNLTSKPNASKTNANLSGNKEFIIIDNDIYFNNVKLTR